MHLEDFEGYRYGEFHKPAIYLDGVEVNDFNEDDGMTVQPRKLLTTMFGGYPIGGGELVPSQMHTVEGYPMYVCDIEGYEDVIYFVKGGVVYAKDENGNDYQVQGLGVHNLRPYYYKDENGVEGEKIKNKSVFYTSFTKNGEDSFGNNMPVPNGGSNAVYKYLPPSGLDFRFKIGNLVNWHKANTYLDTNGTPLQLKGAYFALRLVDTVDTDLTTAVNEAFGIPLMLGYRLDSNILGSNTSEALKNELIETGVVVEDIWNKLPPSFTQAIKVYALRNARYTCYGEIGLLGNGFSGTDVQLENFSNYAYTARRLFKQMTANLYMDSYDGTNIILKGFDKSYTLNGENYDIRICVRHTDNGNDIMVLPCNLGVALVVTVEKDGVVQQNIAVNANLTIYREVREYKVISSTTGYDFLTIKNITNYKSDTKPTTSTTATDTNSLYRALPGTYGTGGGDGVWRHNINGDAIGAADSTIFYSGTGISKRYYPFLTWNAKDFAKYVLNEDTTDKIDDYKYVSTEIAEVIPISDDEYHSDTFPVRFKDNCTFVIEVTGIESKS